LALGRDLFGAPQVRLNGCNQRYTEPGGLKLAIDAQMVAPECAGPGHGGADDGLACYFAASFSGDSPSTALRQRP
jgi:hypothetical protein